MKELIPKPVRRLLSPIARGGQAFLTRQAIKSKRIKPPTDLIALSYAGMVPKPGTIVHGGRVKLAHLGEIYPEQKTAFNILYLVSSSLPPCALEWVETCRQAGVKIVWNQNGVGYPAWAGDSFEEVNAPLKKLIHLADWVIYQSRFCKVSADKFLGEFKGEYSIIYNCVDTSVFTPAARKLPHLPVRLLVMGSHHQSHRVITPLDTLALLLNRNIEAKLTIAGRLCWENAGEEVRVKIDSLGLKEHVEITGPYSQSEAPELYRKSHVLLHPKYNDPCPTVPIEAMSCGVPVIGSGSGGVPELLGQTGGIAVEAPASYEKIYTLNPESIAELVVKISQDWDHWSRQARQRAVESFSKEEWLEQHKKVFGQEVPTERYIK